jgi:hypothetical protein
MNIVGFPLQVAKCLVQVKVFHPALSESNTPLAAPTVAVARQFLATAT